jgi:small subunit ribosomal protein S3
MGQKVNPIGLRLGITRDWESRWYARKNTYRDWVLEDAKIRELVRARFATDGAAARARRGRNLDAGISRIEIERAPNLIKMTLHTAKPGIIIGRGGRGVEDIRAEIERVVNRRVHINVQEVREPELDAQLVAENVASQIERRVAFKRAVRQAVQRSMKMGAKGIRILLSGRLGGAEMSRRYGDRDGKIPLHTLRADIDYGFTEAKTASGNIGVKVWIYRGEVLPQAPPQEAQVERPAPAEKPRKGWRRVGVVRRVSGEEAAEGEAPPSGQTEAPAEQTALAESAREPAASAQAEEQHQDADAIEGEIPKTAEGPPAG